MPDDICNLLKQSEYHFFNFMSTAFTNRVSSFSPDHSWYSRRSTVRTPNRQENSTTYFDSGDASEIFHWTLWCCNLYLWVIMVSDVLLYVREARQWQKQGCSGEPFPRSINQVAVCSVSVVHQTTIWTKKDLESWFSVEGLDWCFCHVTKKQKVSIFPLLLLRHGILLPK